MDSGRSGRWLLLGSQDGEAATCQPAQVFGAYQVIQALIERAVGGKAEPRLQSAKGWWFAITSGELSNRLEGAGT
jgi:hypothetical protein